MTLSDTLENEAKIVALKTIKETQWVGNIRFSNLELCLASLNLNTTNSGWYKPRAIKVKGLCGYFMINEDGSLYWEQRIIKEGDNKFLIEHLSNEASFQFENKYTEILQLKEARK